MGQLQCLNIQVPKREERKQQKLFEEIMDEKFLNLMRTINHRLRKLSKLQAQEIQLKTIPWHIKIKLLNTSGKEKLSKVTRGKKTHYIQRHKTNNENRLLFRNIASQKMVCNTFKILKEKYCQLKIIRENIFQK